MPAIGELLRRYEIVPHKGLGQHFLASPRVLERIVAAAELSQQDTVLEIGAGLGTLTRVLAAASGHVVTVETDRRLIPVLDQELATCSNVQVVEGDILQLNPATLMAQRPYQVVANLPYAITSAVIRHLLEADRPPQCMVLTVQREVAERIVARGGRMSLLTISVHFYGQPRMLFRIPRRAFYPPPEVESAVIRIDRHARLPVQTHDVPAFFRVVRAGFSQPRKQLRNSLAAGLGLAPAVVVEALLACAVDPRRRAEKLGLEEWACVAQALHGERAGAARAAS